MEKNISAILMVALAVLIIVVIALWKQNSKLKDEVTNLKEITDFSSQQNPQETPESTQEELELLQQQLDQLLKLQKKLN